MNAWISRAAALLAVTVLAAAPASIAAEAKPASAADIAALKAYLGADRSYAPQARAEAARRIDALAAEPLTPAQFDLRTAEIAALADNGHTVMLAGRFVGRYRQLPVRFLIASDGLFIAAADAPNAALVGARVETIEGRPWEEVRRSLARYGGGLDGWRAQFLYAYAESPEVLHAAGLAKAPDSLTLGLVRADGGRQSVRLSAAVGKPGEGIEALIPAPRVVALQRDGGAPAVPPPLYLRDPGLAFRMERLPALDALYVQYKANTNFGPGEDVKSFTAGVAAALKADPPRHVILDQRFNYGGDLNNTRELMQALPGAVKPGGKIYMITSARTFSAGVASAGYLKQAGGDRVVIVGEPSGDRLEFWAEGEPTELPDSGVTLLLATERHNYMTGCPEADCHKSIRDHPIRIRTLAPDHLAPLTYAAWAGGRDPAMETIETLIAAAR